MAPNFFSHFLSLTLHQWSNRN